MSRRRGSQRGGRRFEPEFDKPFDFVPLSDQVDKKRAPGHERFRLTDHYSGRLEYRLIARSHLHVSSGNYALSEDVSFGSGEVIRDCYRVTAGDERVPAVPGSSLKGMARAIAEAVTHSCVAVTRVDRRKLPQDARVCRPPKLCPACAIFGTMNRLGRICFSDALLAEGGTDLYRLPALYRPRPRQSPRTYEERGRYKGRKFYFHGQRADHSGGHRVEVITDGSELKGWLDFQSLAPAELGLVFFALGLDGSFQPMLGGGKPVCLGAVEFKPVSLVLVSCDGFTDYDAPEERLEGATLAEFVAARLSNAESSLIVARQRDRLREILDPDNPRPAPTGVY